MRTAGSFRDDRTFTQPVVWITTLFMVVFHLGALAALFVFSWPSFLLALALWWSPEVSAWGTIGCSRIGATKNRSGWKLGMLGLAWDVKTWKLNSGDDKIVAAPAPRRFAV